ncbi:hypothetical protein [Streptomyces sp. NPDC047725]
MTSASTGRAAARSPGRGAVLFPLLRLLVLTHALLPHGTGA